jgi:recombination associated protein RdgC
MYFKAITFYRFSTVVPALDAVLRAHPLKPVGPLSMSSRGWVSPYGAEGTLLAQDQGKNTLVTLGGEDRILPAAVVNKVLAERLALAEQARGRKLGSRARNQLKDDVVAELLPRAFVQPYRLSAHISRSHGFIAVDTGSAKQAEDLCSSLRLALTTFPALPLHANIPPSAVLTGWLAVDGGLPKGLRLGEEAELVDPGDSTVTVKVRNLDLRSDEIINHLNTGMQVKRLGLVLNDRLTFVLDENLVVRKLKILVELAADPDSMEAELDARYAVLIGEVSALFTLLETTFNLDGELA